MMSLAEDQGGRSGIGGKSVSRRLEPLKEDEF